MADQPPTQLNQEQVQKYKRMFPTSDSEFNMLVTDPAWGQMTELSPELRKVLMRGVAVHATDKKGKATEVTFDIVAWELMSIYKRDMRLANLSSGKNPFERNQEAECTYYLNLAGDFLESKMYKAFLICLRRVATILELSQSRNGFLRRRMNTITQESSHKDTTPQKKSLFGVGGGKQ